jgi:hypothetical protein
MLKFYFGCLFGGLKGFRENLKSPLEVEKINGGRKKYCTVTENTQKYLSAEKYY